MCLRNNSRNLQEIKKTEPGPSCLFRNYFLFYFPYSCKAEVARYTSKHKSVKLLTTEKRAECQAALFIRSYAQRIKIHVVKTNCECKVRELGGPATTE